MRTPRSVAKIILASIIVFPLTPMQAHIGHTFESTQIETCKSRLLAFEALLDTYEVSARKTGSMFRELKIAYKNTKHERRKCIKAINQSFKRELETIKSKYDAAKKDSTTKREVREAQRRVEISAAIVRRDEAIKNVGEVPELPGKPVNRK